MLPLDYIVLDRSHAYEQLSPDELLVGCKNRSLIGKSCPSTFRYHGKRYVFDSVDVICAELAGFICSAIRYREAL